MSKVKHIEFDIDARIMVDKREYFFSDKRTWAEARDTFPLDQDITPRRFDLVAEAKAHLAEVRHREKTGERSRYIDTDTESLVAGLERAVKFLKSNPDLVKVKIKEKPTWPKKEKEEQPGADAKEPSAPKPEGSATGSPARK